MINKAPLIDGELNEPVWKQCTELSDFVIWTLDNYISDKVNVYLGYDKNYFYVAFRSTDRNTKSLESKVPEKRPHDTFLWGQNFVSIYLSNGKNSIDLMADPKGTMTDWKNDEMSWNGTWKFETSINKTDWTAELKIPFKDLEIYAPPVGETWELSIGRSYPEGESASWAGEITFSDRILVACNIAPWQKQIPGKNSLDVVLINNNNVEENISVELELIPFEGKPKFINQVGQGPSTDFNLLLKAAPQRFNFNFTIQASSILDTTIIYNLYREGSYYATITCKSDDGSIIKRNNGFWFSLVPNRKRLSELTKLLGETEAVLDNILNSLSPELKKQNVQLKLQIARLKQNLDTAWNENQWDDLTSKIDFIEQDIHQYINKVRWASIQNQQTELDFGLTATHSILKIRKDILFPAEFSKQIIINAAQNEYESFQLVILPFGRDINELRITSSDLTGINGNIIPGSKMEISLVEYNKIDWQPAYLIDYKGWHPDPLVPIDTAINIPGNEICRPVWFTLYIPPSTPAGEYTGSVTVSAKDMQSKSVKIKLRVWDFKLPVKSNLKTHTWDELDNLTKFYNLKEYPTDWYLKFCELLLKNRLNPGFAGVNYVNQNVSSNGEYDFSKVEKILKFCIERGLTRFTIAQLKKGPYTHEEAEKVYRFIRAYSEFLKEKGWLDKSLVELWDEPTELEWRGVMERAKRLKIIEPELPLQLFAEGGPYNFSDKATRQDSLLELVDIWSPFSIIEAPELKAKGKEIWTYFATLARGTAPNFYIDRPAIYQRTIAWYCWMYGVDGFEHWSTTYFWRNIREGFPMDKKYPNVLWDSRTYHYFDGEGQLIYPGPEGMPLSSIRLENFRESMEDYEYLYLLNKLLNEYSKILNYDELNNAKHLLNIDEHLLIKYPRDVKQTLENTIRFPEQPERILKAKKQIALVIESILKKIKYVNNE